MTAPVPQTLAKKPFLTDVTMLRDRARRHLGTGNITASYDGDVTATLAILQTVLATEIVCVLRYTMHAVSAAGLSSESVKAEFKQHAAEEQAHAMAVAQRIGQLGGVPNFNPEGLATRSASQYGEADNLVAMIRENLIAERIAVDHYRELIRYFGNDDPATRVMLESILVAEEEHVSDMHDLLVAYEGVPSLAADPPYGRAGAAAPTHGNHATPNAVLDDQTLSGPQKFEQLNQLKQDSVQLADAANEGMTGGEPAALAEVQHAIDALAEADPHAVPAAAA